MAINRLSWQVVIMSLIAFNLIASLSLLFCPGLLMKINNVMSKWFSTSRLDEAINKRHDIDRSIMGLRIFFGIISFLTSIVLIYIYVKS